jgi:hypothetical protein
MAKPKNTDTQKTEIIRSAKASSKAVDTDDLVTTIRTRIAGTLTIVEGPGKGNSLTFYEGSNSIGRDASRNVIALDFGDAGIHREPHAYLTCKSKALTLAASGKPNPVKHNGQIVSSPTSVSSGDTMQIGETVLRIELS